MTALATGPRPMTDAEKDAVAMHIERTALDVITACTGLSAAQIAAAVDLSRAHARATASRMAAPKPVASPPRRVVIRAAAKPKPVPLALKPPAPLPKPKPEPAPVFAPGTQAWDAIATSGHARIWAVASGWDVPDGPRLPGAIVLAYHAEHGQETTP